MVFFHPYHDKKFTFSFVWTVHQKTTYLPLIKQSLLESRLKGLWVVCWITNHWWYTSVHSFDYLSLCATILLYKAPAHTDPHNGHQLILQCWSPKCVCGYVQRYIIFLIIYSIEYSIEPPSGNRTYWRSAYTLMNILLFTSQYDLRFRVVKWLFDHYLVTVLMNIWPPDIYLH